MRGWLVLVAVAALTAGCGGGGSKSASADVGGTAPAGAGQVPASVPVFVTLDSSFGASWKALTTLVDRFPGKAKLIASAQQSLAKDGVDFDKDIKATVGPEVDFALWDLAGGSVQTVGLTQPKDKTAFEQALGKGKDASVFTEVNGWVLFASKQASLDAFKALGGSKLDADDSFQAAFKDVPSSALARVYANGTALGDSLAAALKSAGPAAGSLNGLGGGGGKLLWIVGAAEPKDGGFKLEAVVKTKGGKSENFDATLLGKVPASAFAVTVFDGQAGSSLGSQLESLQKSQLLGGSAAQLQSVTGASLGDIAQLLSGQGVIYARAGTPIPEVTLLEGSLDTGKAIKTLDKLASALAQLTKQTPASVEVAGEKVTQVTLGKGVSLFYGKVDGNLVVTTSQAAIADLKSDGGKLVDDPAFKKAQSEAGDTSKTAGLLYVNVQNAVATVDSLAQLAGSKGASPETKANVAPLRGFLFFADALDKDTLRITGFLGVQ